MKVSVQCAFRAVTYGNKLGVASSLRELLAELMEEKTGVCDSYCYVEIDGTRHFFQDQFVDRNNPCIVYYCDNGRVERVDISTRCQKRPCPGGSRLLYYPGECCQRCLGECSGIQCCSWYYSFINMKVDNRSPRLLNGLNGLSAVRHVDKDSNLGAGLVLFHPMLLMLETAPQ